MGTPRNAACHQDPAGDHDWGISALVDLDASDEAGSAVLRITDVGQLSGFQAPGSGPVPAAF